MTALSNQPINRNFLDPLKFRFAIKKTPTVNFFAQSVIIPGLSIAPPKQGTPFVVIPHSGEHIDFQPLQITFMVDEDLANYLELFNWLISLGFPDNFNQYKELAEQPRYSGLGIKSEATIFILSSSNNAKFEVVFEDAFPIALGPMQFGSADSDIQYVTATATFSYTRFKIQPA